MRAKLMPNVTTGTLTTSVDAKATTLRRLERERRRLKRQIERVKLRSKYDEILGVIVDRKQISRFRLMRTREALVSALRRLRDLLHEHPSEDIETSSSSESESDDDGTPHGMQSHAPRRQRRPRGINFRSLEVSRSYLLKEVLEMIRVEDKECWSKNAHSSADSSAYMKEELQEAVGEVLRAFYGFPNIESCSTADFEYAGK